MTKDITISIVSYNNAPDVCRAVESIELHTDPAIQKQIFIIDNKDDASVYAPLAEKYSDVTYIHTGENLGYARGNNLVLDQIDSRYHAIANPDILFPGDALSPIMQYMDENKDVGMVIPKIVNEEGDILPVYRTDLTLFDMFIRKYFSSLFQKRMEKHTMADQDYTKPFQVPFGQGSFLVIRTALYKELKGFDENFFLYVEDADLCKRVNQVSRLMYYPGAEVIHKWKRESRTNKTLMKEHIKSAKYYFKKWGFRIF